MNFKVKKTANWLTELLKEFFAFDIFVVFILRFDNCPFHVLRRNIALICCYSNRFGFLRHFSFSHILRRAKSTIDFRLSSKFNSFSHSRQRTLEECVSIALFIIFFITARRESKLYNKFEHRQRWQVHCEKLNANTTLNWSTYTKIVKL